ncbi:shikimate dehydrogenase [Nitrosomonas aestuarii]|uniref:Shikimate dehydrogenase (NADP(+)) n=1 Tax=Nitrosomonas aestuarii TaxID=52441 RepID=A0A1I4CNV6_9PROT|nr:shikimate dehydrogenase [Nitrosomonas aestuarii]SFK81947.1 shikimate dehydrogenase [Nitrosomonas aestuarii]
MTDRYAVIGNPIAHSKSPLIHSAFAQQTRQNMRYDAILAPLDGFKTAADTFHHQGGKGINVTIPFKLEAHKLATSLTERADIAQAVNTLKFVEDQILGDNTDGAGLVRDIVVNLSTPITEKRILLMGAGGAARGAILPLLQQKPAILAIANRTPQKAVLLKKQFIQHGQLDAGEYMYFAGASFDIVINATSASLNDALPALPPDIFAVDALAYDMMYSAEPTRFLKYAGQQGVCNLADGIGMLVEQAAESFYLWRGIRPETKDIISRFKKPDS